MNHIYLENNRPTQKP